MYVLVWGQVYGLSWLIFLPFNLSTTLSKNRIGPHNIDIISILIGNLLSNGHGEKRSNSYRFTIHMNSRNIEYLMWLHKFYANRGYCNNNKPKLYKQIGKNCKIYYTYKFNTYSFLNF